jgi:tetratricopeptide (TPR) repeat protein
LPGLVCLLASCTAPAFGLQAVVGEASRRADNAVRLAQAGDLAKAESELRTAVKLSPTDARYLSDLGSILRAQNKPGEAVEFYRRALAIEPANILIRRNQALTLWDLDRLAEAKKELNEVLAAKPEDELTALMLGMLEEKLGDHARAEKLFSSVSGLVAKNPQLLLATAGGYYRQRQPAQAVKLLELLRTNTAAELAALFSAARLASEANDWPTAQKILLELERRGSRDGSVYNLLGQSYAQQGKLPQAVESFNRAIAEEPYVEQHYLDLARVLASYNQWRPALVVAGKAVVRFPNSEPLYEVKGLAETVLLLTNDAMGSYSRALEINPASAKANLGLAVAQRAAGMIQQAAATFERGIKKFPQDAFHYQEYGLMLLKETRSGDAAAETQAIAMLERAIALDDTLSEAHYELGSIALGRRQTASALMHLERAARLEPNVSKMHFALSRAYRQLGRSTDASREFEQYQTIKAGEEKSNPGFPAVGRN